MKKITYILIFIVLIFSCNKQVENRVGTISYLDCENIVYDSLNQIITIPFYGGNGGNYAAQTLNSKGITGLTATLKSGSFSNSKTLDDLTATLQGNDDVNGFLTFKLSGTPSSKKGIAYFDLSIGGQNCSFSIPIGSNNNNQGGGTDTNNDPIISSLDCESVNVLGTLKKGQSIINSYFTINYSGGNGKYYSAQSYGSKGVSGLEIYLQSGTLTNGSGSLTYTITGTPSSSGTAQFDISFAGKSCTVIINVENIIQNPTTGYGPNITDIDGNTYKTVYIGTQQWMAENLKVTKYNDGTAIPNVTDNTQWSNLTTGARCYYNNDAANNAKYGKLYNWYAVSPTTNNNKNVCPAGWHVPTDAEWTVLIDYLGGENVAGGKMKEVGTTNWISPNTDATNTSLFTGLPGGFRFRDGSYNYIRNYGLWWSSAEGYYSSNAWNRDLGYDLGGAGINSNSKEMGLSVRCLRD